MLREAIIAGIIHEYGVYQDLMNKYKSTKWFYDRGQGRYIPARRKPKTNKQQEDNQNVTTSN